MENFARKITCKGMDCVEFAAGGYRAIVALDIGSNVLRLRNEERNVEFFRWSDEVSGEEIKQATEIWGLPSLYLPNRHDKGVLRTSDSVYNFPINEVDLQNLLHGFVHRRAHKLESMSAEGGTAVVKTSYLYDEKDEMYSCFPVKFLYELTFTLSSEGLKHEVKLTNLCDKALPVSFATHTTINAPFVDGARQENIRLTVPGVKKCELDARCLPTEKYSELTAHDLEYFNGEKCPVLVDISNDMYTAGEASLDGKPFYGFIAKDIESGLQLCNEVSSEYKFWIVWNDRGFKGYFCPEPMTAMINAANLSLPREESGYSELMQNESFTATQKFFVK